jgi:hypothetical protein
VNAAIQNLQAGGHWNELVFRAMIHACRLGRHIALQDRKAPYRGRWMIATNEHGKYWALHDAPAADCTDFTSNGSAEASHVVEEREFNERKEACRFVKHLVIHGWTLCEQQSGNGCTGLLS